ncbi:Reversal of tor2 lethality [Oleoguttula sp. CCFEE 5521]
MRASLPASLLGLVALSSAQTWPFNIVGTWSTKSNKTLTGPGFYDPVNENLIEPERTGISYSFTGDGHYEEAYYRAISNPANPACPSGIMQWQHGGWVMNANGSLSLTPIAIDGRQLLSEPCKGGNSVYTRYNQTELFERYEYLIDPYHNITRLNLFRFDGSPLNPMYLVMSPPMMLPTTTLHPPSATATAGSKNSKRGLDVEVPINWKSKLEGSEGAQVVRYVNAERLWWVGLAMTGVGGLLYVGPRRMGVTL